MIDHNKQMCIFIIYLFQLTLKSILNKKFKNMCNLWNDYIFRLFLTTYRFSFEIIKSKFNFIHTILPINDMEK